MTIVTQLVGKSENGNFYSKCWYRLIYKLVHVGQKVNKIGKISNFWDG